MAQVLKPKRKFTAGAPTTSDLVEGEIAINTADKKLYIRDNANQIISIGGGSAGSSFVDYEYTASAGQTTFSGGDNNSKTLAYTAGQLQVYLNGILLELTVDYVASNGTQVVLQEAAVANDVVQISTFSNVFAIADQIVSAHTGNGSTTAFTLSAVAGDEANTQVFIDGIYQAKTTYSLSGSTLTFSEAPPASSDIEVVIGSKTNTFTDTTQINLSGGVSATFLTAGLTTATTSISTTVVVNTHLYVIAAGLTITLPASPTAGQRVLITIGNFTNTIIARNGSNIMSLAENMTLNLPYASAQFVFIDATRGWTLLAGGVSS